MFRHKVDTCARLRYADSGQRVGLLAAGWSMAGMTGPMLEAWVAWQPLLESVGARLMEPGALALVLAARTPVETVEGPLLPEEALDAAAVLHELGYRDQARELVSAVADLLRYVGLSAQVVQLREAAVTATGRRTVPAAPRRRR